jgi:hypothetical protein
VTRERHTGKDRAPSEAFQRYPGDEPNNPDTGSGFKPATSFAGMRPAGFLKGFAQFRNKIQFFLMDNIH